MDATDYTRLAVAQGIYKAVVGEVKTGKESNIRGRADNSLRDLYSATGATSVDLKIGVTRVGKLTLKASPAHAVINDPDDFGSWVMDTRPYCVTYTLEESLIPPDELDALYECHPEWFWRRVDERAALESIICVGGQAVDSETGEVVPGVEWVPDGVGATVVTGCGPTAVAEALKTNLIDANAVLGLLEGGE